MFPLFPLQNPRSLSQPEKVTKTTMSVIIKMNPVALTKCFSVDRRDLDLNLGHLDLDFDYRDLILDYRDRDHRDLVLDLVILLLIIVILIVIIVLHAVYYYKSSIMVGFCADYNSDCLEIRFTTNVIFFPH